MGLTISIDPNILIQFREIAAHIDIVMDNILTHHVHTCKPTRQSQKQIKKDARMNIFTKIIFQSNGSNFFFDKNEAAN